MELNFSFINCDSNHCKMYFKRWIACPLGFAKGDSYVSKRKFSSGYLLNVLKAYASTHTNSIQIA